jgi:hypothetical protein
MISFKYKVIHVKLDMEAINIQLYLPSVLWVAFLIPSGSLLCVNHLVYEICYVMWYLLWF